MAIQTLRIGDTFRFAGESLAWRIVSRCDCGHVTCRSTEGDVQRFSCQDERTVVLIEASVFQMEG